MADKIFLVGAGGALQPMAEQPYEEELHLQEFLAKYVDLLPGEQMNPASPRRWVLVSKEVAIADSADGADRWSLDHLFLDQDGIPTLVETKRSCDTRLRREVVGQLLEYAANAVVYWPVERLRADFRATCELRGEDSEQTLRVFLGDDAATDDKVSAAEPSGRASRSTWRRRKFA